MTNPNLDGAPRFIREAPYMPGYYEWTEHADVNSKYFRYQSVPADKPFGRERKPRETWTYSADDERQGRFKVLIDAGVLSAEVADYLETAYYGRTNIFFVGGEDTVRRELMEAVAATRPELNLVRFSDEPFPAEPEDAAAGGYSPQTYWEFPEDGLISRNDVVFYDGKVPTETTRSFLMCRSVHHIVLAGFSEATAFQMTKFRFPKPKEGDSGFDFKSLIVRLGDVDIRDRGIVNGVVDVRKYNDYFNASNLDEQAWTRLLGKLVQVHSTRRY